MKTYFNLKRWQLVVLWLVGLFWVLAESDSYSSSEFVTVGVPILLALYTIGWLGNRNSSN